MLKTLIKYDVPKKVGNKFYENLGIQYFSEGFRDSVAKKITRYPLQSKIKILATST